MEAIAAQAAARSLAVTSKLWMAHARVVAMIQIPPIQPMLGDVEIFPCAPDGLGFARQAPDDWRPTTLYAARSRLIPFNSNSPTGSRGRGSLHCRKMR